VAGPWALLPLLLLLLLALSLAFWTTLCALTRRPPLPPLGSGARRPGHFKSSRIIRIAIASGNGLLAS
jgi:hypothetical protein